MGFGVELAAFPAHGAVNGRSSSVASGAFGPRCLRFYCSHVSAGIPRWFCRRRPCAHVVLECLCYAWKEMTPALGCTQPVTRVPSQGSRQLLDALNFPAVTHPLTGEQGGPESSRLKQAGRKINHEIGNFRSSTREGNACC